MFDNCLDYDSRLQLPNHMIIVGMTMSGKTTLILRLLSSIELFNPVPTSIYFFYNQYQDAYTTLQTRLKSQGVELFLRNGCDLSLEDFEKGKGQKLVILDDATAESSSSAAIAKLTTNGRHLGLSICLLWHSLYSKHPASRLITQNTSYFFFLPSVRLISQIHTMDSQLRMHGRLVSAYKMATEDISSDFRYLLLDISPRSNVSSIFQLRSNVHKDVQDIFI